MSAFRRLCLLSLYLAFGVGPALSQPAQNAPSAPEAATGFAPRPAVAAQRFMAATANPHATRAAQQILRTGGSAVDAAIAAQLVLTLTEPQSSGIGGGAFLMHWDGQQVVALDGRETAPAAVDERLFLQCHPACTPMPFYKAVVGGRAVGVPGVLRMLQEAHQRWGKLPWNALFEPAIRLATQGFTISPRLAALLADDPFLKNDPTAAAYFLDAQGRPKAAGTLLKNPALASTLHLIAKQGVKAFYEGKLARAIVHKVRNHPGNPGLLSVEDLRDYRAVEREPICRPYRQWRVCGFGPPSSGGLAVAQLLAMLEPRNISVAPPQDGVPNPDAVHLVTELLKRAFADRNAYVADTDFVPLPGADFGGLLDPEYLRQRSLHMWPRSTGRAMPGLPPGLAPRAAGPDLAEHGTSHLVIIDAQGHAVSMTTTIEDAFGARQMVGGFLLNNQLTDFSFMPQIDGQPVANRVQPGKRPRSSMAPTLVFDSEGKLYAALGSPGGSLIISYVFTTLVALLDWHMPPDQAVALPHFGSRNAPPDGTLELEAGRMPASTASDLSVRGHAVQSIDMNSGLQAVIRTPQGWLGATDPRREGLVLGD
jgi:gamma-glutamyltranspeptidase/glutathione hydrolase